jgi:pimeloyl-ACP methyl ester carboxylesterase
MFLPGFRSDMAGTKATFLDDFCAARDLAYVRFDYSGHGESSMERSDAGRRMRSPSSTRLPMAR